MKFGGLFRHGFDEVVLLRNIFPEIVKLQVAVLKIFDELKIARSNSTAWTRPEMLVPGSFGLALKIGEAFGGGIAGMGHVCGAVAGAYMVIGLKCGRTDPDDEASKKRAIELVDQFTKRFMGKNISIICRELIKCDLRTKDGHEYFRENDLRNSKCLDLVEDAALILDEIL